MLPLTDFHTMIAAMTVLWTCIALSQTQLSIKSREESLKKANKKIFSEWLPNCKEYEIASEYCIEMYNNPADYPKGTQDEME